MRTWPHAPSKCVQEPGTYIVTAGTYKKECLFHDDERLELLHDLLLEVMEEQGWELMALAVFDNHYHFVGVSPKIPNPVGKLCGKVHMVSAKELNALDDTPGRKVWYRSWDTKITFEKSLMARIAYVHNNPVKHGLVRTPEEYQWCSAAWFLREGDRPFVETVLSFKTDRVNVYDDF
ncbi:MAG: transposase [Armatimonadetes bacterium]|nr:transposase [Armatimonadota bacterium]